MTGYLYPTKACNDAFNEKPDMRHRTILTQVGYTQITVIRPKNITNAARFPCTVDTGTHSMDLHIQLGLASLFDLMH